MVQKLSVPLNDVDGRGPATLLELSAPSSTLDWMRWCENSLVDEKGIYLFSSLLILFIGSRLHKTFPIIL